ncbi:hypothetical protein P4O66_021393, partial [Electrophorus voltai]
MQAPKPVGATTTPMNTTATTTAAATIEATVPPFQPPTGHYTSPHHTPYNPSPYLYPSYYPHYHEDPLPPVQPTAEYTTRRISVPKRTQKPQMSSGNQLPQLPQVPIFPVLPTASPKMLPPSLNCTKDRFVVVLPSAKMESIKVKDVKRNVWVPVISAPADCEYSMLHEGKWVALFSPLPACHMRTLSPSILSLSLKFWDPALLRHRTLQLQCSYTSPQTAAMVPTLPWTWPTSSLKPKPVATPSQPSKPSQPQQSVAPPPLSEQSVAPPPLSEQSVAPPPLSEQSVAPPPLSEQSVAPPPLSEQSVAPPPFSQPLLTLPFYPPKPTAQSFQPPKHILATSWPTEHSLLPEITPLLSQTDTPQVRCYSQNMSVSLPPGPITGLTVHKCTADRNFVFSIPASLTDPPLSPAFLVAAGNSSCTPQRVVGDSALFKIPLDGCGVHRYEVGNSVIYMLEILNTLQSLSVSYGTITRDSPFRLLVECRYLPGAVASVGYLVKSPSLIPSIRAQGVFGVQLRIAKDQQYSSYYPQYHRPLRKLLGKPLYLEVRLLNPPDPSMVLLVHYCVAYPRSAHSVWILIYDGCPNPLDVTSTLMSPPPPQEAVANHVKRFTISTFQFLKSSSGQLETGGLRKKEEE